MSTSNFHNVNASRVFACELENDYDYQDLKDNLESELSQLDEYQDGGHDRHELRSFPSHVLGSLNTNGYWGGICIEVRVSAIIRSGYYAGCNLDWALQYSTGGSDWVYSLDQDDLNYEGLNNQQATRAINWVNQVTEELITKLEKIYKDYSIPLRVVATFSNGETVYEKATL